MMTTGIYKVKAWVIEKAQREAKKYDMWFSVPECGRDENRMHIYIDNCDHIIVEELLEETEKAVKVNVATGAVVGSCKGWTMWIPKSQIVEVIA